MHKAHISERSAASRLPSVVVIGGGIAGAGLGFALAGQAEVTLLEREEQCGYHSTGRSAASFTETYGSSVIRRLAIGSRSFLMAPPPSFAEAPVLTPRGTVTIARADQLDALAIMLAGACSLVPSVHAIDPAEARRRVPILREDYVAGAVSEPNAMDVDVHGLHSGLLRGARAGGCHVVTGAEVVAIDRVAGQWDVRTQGSGRFRADILVNAAGAWADMMAVTAGVAPLGLEPRRRTAMTIDVPPDVRVQDWPLIDDVDGEFYFKADAGALFVSPADATPCAPTDARPEEIDVAVGIERLQRTTTLSVTRVRHSWAGLRTFAADGNPVVGRDEGVPDFVWLAGQGGYGIKTSPALSRICAAAVLGLPFPPDLAALGLTASDLLPGRLRVAAPGFVEEHA